MKELKPWVSQFIDEYLANGNNGTQAYLTAKPNVKSSTARNNAARLLATASVKAELRAHRFKLKYSTPLKG